MAALSGTAGSVVYMTGGTTTVQGIKEWSLDIGMDPSEITAFGDQWRRIIAGIRQFSGSFSGNADDDTSQTNLRNAMLGGSAIALRLYDKSTSYYNVGSAFLTNMGPSVSYDGEATNSFDFDGNGALTYV
jgi:predicted secreted protein